MDTINVVNERELNAMDSLELTREEKVFLSAYVEAIYFTETGDLEQPDVDAELCEDFSRESVIDCLAMYSRMACYLSDDNIEQAGHDFWLTRNHHGTGYWDRPEIYGESYTGVFTTYAEAFGEAYAMFDDVNEGGE